MYYIDYLLTDRERAALHSAGVVVAEMSVGTSVFHRSGIAFEEADANTVIETLGLLWEGHGYEDLSMPHDDEECLEGYYLLELDPLPTPNKPVVGSEAARFYEECQPELRQGLVVRAPGRWTRHMHRANTLFVNIYSSPTERYSEGVVEENGRRERRLVPRRPGPEYTAIRFGRVVVAYFRGDSSGGSLWILFRPGRVTNLLIEYVLFATARLMFPELGEVPTFTEFRHQSVRRRYVRSAVDRLEREQENIHRTVEEADEAVEEARRQVVQRLRQATAMRRRREQLTSQGRAEMLRELTERMEQEFGAIADSGDFESLEFNEEKFIVVTRPIKLRHDGRVYEMGRYCIEVGRERINIRAQGRSRQEYGAQHPHVSSEGDACFGNVTDAVGKLQAEMLYGQLLQFLIRYLEHSYNPADCNARIEAFDVTNYPESEEATRAGSNGAARRRSAGGGNRSRRNSR